MRGVEHEQIKTRRARLQHPCRAAEQVVVGMNGSNLVDRLQHGGISRDQCADGDVLFRQRGRHRANDISEAASLHQRKDFRGHRQNA